MRVSGETLDALKVRRFDRPSRREPTHQKQGNGPKIIGKTAQPPLQTTKCSVSGQCVLVPLPKRSCRMPAPTFAY